MDIFGNIANTNLVENRMNYGFNDNNCTFTWIHTWLNDQIQDC